MVVAKVKLNLAFVMDMDLILKVHAAKTINLPNVLGFLASIIVQVSNESEYFIHYPYFSFEGEF